MEDEKKYIGCDVHREYSVIREMDERGTLGPSMRVKHSGGELERLLQSFPPGSPVAVETSGSAMWALGIVEAAGLEPHLAHALEVKKRIAGAFQTDESDAAGLAMLLRNGTLREVWIASPSVRDLRGHRAPRGIERDHLTTFTRQRVHHGDDDLPLEHLSKCADGRDGGVPRCRDHDEIARGRLFVRSSVDRALSAKRETTRRALGAISVA